MGVKDYVEDGTGHTLSLPLDLDYLHVDGAERQANLHSAAGAGRVQVLQGPGSASSNSTHSGSSSCSNLFEESVVSEGEEERLQHGSGSESQNPQEGKRAQLFLQESSVSGDLPQIISQGDPSQEATLPPTDPDSDYRTKVDFARKLGYSEELVVLVMRKLGPDALTNDILGELVKLGTKAETEQHGSLPTSQSSSSSSSLACSSSSSSLSSSSSSDSCRTLYQLQLKDIENLRPIVVDGSNVAMR